MSKKITESEKSMKIYPSLILGLDISTACIGVSIVLDFEDKEPEVIDITHITPKIPKDKTGIEALILRKDIFEKDFLTTISDRIKCVTNVYENIHDITECIIESPMKYATASSNAQTVAQLLQFNGLISEAVYRVLGLVPHYITSYDARMYSFPKLLSIRKFNKRGEVYPLKHIEKALKDEHLILFGDYPFDCDKKSIMMNMVCEKYPSINWVYNSKGELKKENYDACDSLICCLAYINQKRYGELKPSIIDYSISEKDENGEICIAYKTKSFDNIYEKKMRI